ncbi:TonB-dependent receptor plug domain-containing protein [Novosphingobium sp. UBA1939]|uniref:TonB-dependent receptor plug domain-containing protein n=1 Tax=Novosphingobium sp. UBA1939 TaxID=1946982 RepID=UPI0025DA416D|nr:TonB-dependent receptor [Novosphingobium sp. UBA1939]
MRGQKIQVCLILTALAAACWGSVAEAQSALSFSETIVVTGAREAPNSAAFETRHALDPLSAPDAASADELLRALPALHLPTNSRGETIAFVRNAAERQVAIFYEGADINIPWDNRLDLSLIPAGLIGAARSAAGPLAPHYGVNALAAISLSPIERNAGAISYGTGNRVDGRLAVVLGPATIGGSYARRDGDPLPGNARLPYSQTGRTLRTNTDRELASLFGRVKGRVAAQDVSLTAFHVWGSKGIAPEGNRDTGARFWRYPDVRHTLIVGNARSALGASTELDSTVWHQRFGQTIDDYASAAYHRVNARQIDRDRTWGLRELLKHRAGAAMFVGSFNLLQSTHRQRDIAYVDGNPPTLLPAPLFYKQRNWSIGGEIEYDLSRAVRGEIGIGYDVVDYLRTGDKPPVDKARDWTGRAALIVDAGDGWRLRGAIGRKMRAPTMRERFGEAIKRFLPNPALKPEQILSAEIAAEWRGRNGSFYLIPFAQDLDNTIDQRRVGSLRQRINLAGSTVQGAELGGDWRPHRHLTLSGNATWARARRKQNAAGELNRLAEKPAVLANARADYTHPRGATAAIEARYVGRAYSADSIGALVPLRTSTSVDMHLGHRFEAGGQPFEAFVHLANIGDTVIEPQLGLPGPGRAIRVGIRMR